MSDKDDQFRDRIRVVPESEVVKAVAAERERCAKIAESTVTMSCDADCHGDIAAMIRGEK